MISASTEPLANMVGDYGSMAEANEVETGGKDTQAHLPSRRSSSIISKHAYLEMRKSSMEKSSTAVRFDAIRESKTTSLGLPCQIDQAPFLIGLPSGGKQNALRQLAINASLLANLAILTAKVVAYIRTLSLAVLAALLDSVLDVVSQLVLYLAERISKHSVGRSTELYPAGAARLEPLGVLTCAAMMGIASFEVLKESIEALVCQEYTLEGENWSSVWNMLSIVVAKVLLLVLCRKASKPRTVSVGRSEHNAEVFVTDPTLEALAVDHLNDALSNAVAAVSLTLTIVRPSLWWMDPVGAIVISVYIIFAWYFTGKEQIEQLMGKAAPSDFIEELRHIAASYDSRIIVDVCRAYHFGPKFLVEVTIVLPKDTKLVDTRNISMELQYKIEERDEVERCFVQVDYESREYDEHVISKVPDLLQLIREQRKYS